MKTSARGRALIEQREGRRLTAYRDSVGVWTIGVGHTGRMAPPLVTPGMTITAAQSDAFLAADLAPVEAAIARNVTMPLSQNEFDALASLAFNTGVGALAKSKTVVGRLNRGDIKGAADGFLLWAHPSVLEGRRVAERAQFLEPDPPNGTGISRSAAVANQRAQHLAVKTGAKTAQARITGAAGAAIVAGGTVAAAVASHAGHGPIAIWIIGLVGLGGAVDAAVAWWHARGALRLAANAQSQAKTALGFKPASPAPETQTHLVQA